MNKIRVVNNVIIPFDNESVVICDDVISFTSNGNYVVEYIDSSDIKIKYEIKDNICINLFEYSICKDIIVNNSYYLGNYSSLIMSKFYGNRNTKEKIDIYLEGKRSSIKYNFSSISSGNDKYIINVYHNGNESLSDIFNRTVAKEGSSNYFDINSYVENGKDDCYINQETKIITLGESDNRINPNMFTHDNSVVAIHSSTIGSIDSESLFYLMSRGIEYKDSIKLIIKGMILSNINPDMEIREKIINILDSMGGE